MAITKREFGFTGTQKGMTEAQKRVFKKLLKGAHTLHHGDCVGADAQAHALAREVDVDIQIVLHPPSNPDKRAWCGADFYHDVKPYLDRNKDIVNYCQILIATPETREEQLRSGTWSTVRYARKRNKSVVIIYPDGSYDKM